MVQRDVFLKFYANLPVSVRQEVVLVLSEAKGPITWEVAYREINAETALGDVILKKLIQFGFLPVK